ARRLPAFADCPHHQRLPAPDIAGRPQPVYVGLVVPIIRRHVARPTPVGVDVNFSFQFAQDAVFQGAGKADGDEGEIGADDELGARDRLTFLVHFAAANTGQLTLLANELQSSYLELALGPLRLARGGSHLGRPVGPDRKLVFPFRGLRPYVELGDSHRTLPEGRADAIRGGVAAADDDNMLSACHDRLGRPGNRLDILATNAPVLLHQI